RQRAEFQNLERQTAEVLEGGADNGAPFRGRPGGKRSGQVVFSDAAMRSVEDEEQGADRVAGGPHQRVGQHVDDRLKRPNEQVFEPAPHDSRPRNHVRKPAAGSIDAVSGTNATGRSRRSSAASRTASLAVVSTMAAAAF